MTKASEPLASVLRSARDLFNAQFAAARRLFPELDADQFRGFLVEVVDPLAVAVDAVCPERVAEVVMSAYQLGLELLGKRLIGFGGKSGIVGEGWRTLAAAAAPVMASFPDRALSAVANALLQLANTPGARPNQWIHDLGTIAPRCPDLETLLAAGQVLAWRAGLAHYRAGALAVADSLPGDLALLAVGATGDWAAIRKRLEEDPWFVPEPSLARPVAREVGAFRGLGGTSPSRRSSRSTQATSSSRAARMRGFSPRMPSERHLHRATAEERSAAPRAALPRNGPARRGAGLPRPDDAGIDLRRLDQRCFEPDDSGAHLVVDPCRRARAAEGARVSAPAAAPLTELRDSWLAVSPKALESWSRFTRLRAPTLCLTDEEARKDEADRQLRDDPSRRSIRDRRTSPRSRRLGLGDFAHEVLAHEIGHHVLAPATLTDHGRIIARTALGVADRREARSDDREICIDLLINDRLPAEHHCACPRSMPRLQKGKKVEHCFACYLRIYGIPGPWHGRTSVAA